MQDFYFIDFKLQTVVVNLNTVVLIQRIIQIVLPHLLYALTSRIFIQNGTWISAQNGTEFQTENMTQCTTRSRSWNGTWNRALSSALGTTRRARLRAALGS